MYQRNLFLKHGISPEQWKKTTLKFLSSTPEDVTQKEGEILFDILLHGDIPGFDDIMKDVATDCLQLLVANVDCKNCILKDCCTNLKCEKPDLSGCVASFMFFMQRQKVAPVNYTKEQVIEYYKSKVEEHKQFIDAHPETVKTVKS